MTLDHFLEKFVEGYLFGDLRAMARIRVPDGEQYGGAGYPMVMTTMAGIELLAALTSERPFDKWDGQRSFRDFWQHALYRDQRERHQIANLVYELVRQPLAHTFMTKPIVEIRKARDSNHLCRVGDVASVM
jgi:hypothetical protein